MTVIEGLRRARAHAGLSLTAVAHRSGIAASNLSTIEHARRDPTAGTIDRVAHALGIALIPVITGGRSTLAEAGEAILAALEAGDDRLAYRTVIQVADDLVSAEPFTRALLAAEPPSATGTPWDALLAAVAEWRLADAGLPAPAWVTAASGDSGAVWQPPGALLPARPDQVPEPLLRRGVLIEAGEFASA